MYWPAFVLSVALLSTYRKTSNLLQYKSQAKKIFRVEILSHKIPLLDESKSVSYNNVSLSQCQLWIKIILSWYHHIVPRKYQSEWVQCIKGLLNKYRIVLLLFSISEYSSIKLYHFYQSVKTNNKFGHSTMQRASNAVYSFSNLQHLLFDDNHVKLPLLTWSSLSLNIT